MQGILPQDHRIRMRAYIVCSLDYITTERDLIAFCLRILSVLRSVLCRAIKHTVLGKDEALKQIKFSRLPITFTSSS